MGSKPLRLLPSAQGSKTPCRVWGISMCSHRQLHAYYWTNTLHLHIPDSRRDSTARRRKWEKSTTCSSLTCVWRSNLLPGERRRLSTPDPFIELAVHKLVLLMCNVALHPNMFGCVIKGSLCLVTYLDYVHVLIQAFRSDHVWKWFDTPES